MQPGPEITCTATRHSTPRGWRAHLSSLHAVSGFELEQAPERPSRWLPGARDLGYKCPQCVAESLALETQEKNFFASFLHILVCFLLCLTFRREAEFFLRVLDKVSSLALRGMGISFCVHLSQPWHACRGTWKNFLSSSSLTIFKDQTRCDESSRGGTALEKNFCDCDPSRNACCRHRLRNRLSKMGRSRKKQNVSLHDKCHLDSSKPSCVRCKCISMSDPFAIYSNHVVNAPPKRPPNKPWIA